MKLVSGWRLAPGLIALFLPLVVTGCFLNSDPGDPLPPPSISDFAASSALVTAGTTSTLTATFQNGIGTVDHGVGIVTSGTPVRVSPAADTTYALTVTNADEVSVVATATIRVVPPSRITSFVATPVTVYEGSSSTLTATYENGSGTVDHSLGALPSGASGLATRPLWATTTFALTVTNEAGDSVQATAVVTVRRLPVVVPTGGLAQPRAAHTATRLLDGKVLMLGGFADANLVWAETAELYDPATGTSTLTGSPIHPRGGHTATLLPSGEVLVAGGVGRYEPSLEAELYDPASGTFRTTGAMTARRTDAAAALLPNGKVLIAGGVDVNTNQLHATAETYDPATGSFKATAGSMSGFRLGATALSIPGGKVMLAGGYTGIGRSRLVEQFDPATETFAAAGSVLTDRTSASWTLLADGKVLIAGGATPNPPLEFFGSAEMYDPVDGSCRVLPGSLGTPRAGHTATLLMDGTVLIAAGGWAPDSLASLELFDPASETFSRSAAALRASRNSHTATLLKDGRVLISGGMDQLGVLGSQELYEP